MILQVPSVENVNNETYLQAEIQFPVKQLKLLLTAHCYRPFWWNMLFLFSYTCSHLCKQSPWLCPLFGHWLGSWRLGCLWYQRQDRHFKAELTQPDEWASLRCPPSLLPVELLQAASAGSNYYVSVPVKEIPPASLTLSSCLELGEVQ